MADTKESLKRKREAYLATFCGDGDRPHPMGAQVLADLRMVVGLHMDKQKSCAQLDRNGAVDPYASLILAAKREIYLRIVGFLSIDEKHLFQESTHDNAQTGANPPTAER